MNRLALCAIFALMTLLGAIGSLGLKKGASQCHGLISLVFNKWFIGGGFLYFISALLDIWLLKYIPYVIVLPLTALTYCWSMMLARLVLKERVSPMKMVGLALIILGMILLVV
jgi:drug/metabolite transporter (DMT)-like permease